MRNSMRKSIKQLIIPKKQQYQSDLEHLKNTERILLEKNLIAGYHPKHIEAQIIQEMKRIAVSKLNDEKFDEALSILKKVLEVQRSPLSSEKYKESEIAHTFYLSGVVLSKLDCLEAAILDFKETIKKLSPEWQKLPNLDKVNLSDAYYELGIIYGKKNDYIRALNYLDQCRIVEINRRGFVHERTSLMINTFELRWNRSLSNGECNRPSYPERRNSFVIERHDKHMFERELGGRDTRVKSFNNRKQDMVKENFTSNAQRRSSFAIERYDENTLRETHDPRNGRRRSFAFERQNAIPRINISSTERKSLIGRTFTLRKHSM